MPVHRLVNRLKQWTADYYVVILTVSDRPYRTVLFTTIIWLVGRSLSVDGC